MSQKRIVTRSDFDGLLCAVLLKKVEDIGEIKFVHPKDVQDGIVEITANDILANIPFDPRCHLCFDHHSSEAARIADDPKRILLMAPSAARVIYDHYGAEKFPSMKGLVESADRVDSADLEMEDVTDPKGWILLGFIMDPRTGLGRFRHFKISNYQLMMNMVDSIGQSSAEEVLALPDVKERVDLYHKQNEVFKNSLPNFSRLDGNVVVSDIRNLDEVPAGNRFLVYTVYPQCNVNLWVSWGFKKQNVAVATGYNIFNKTCQTDVGELMSEYGGGGHEAAGTCQLDTDKADALISEIVNKLKAKG